MISELIVSIFSSIMTLAYYALALPFVSAFKIWKNITQIMIALMFRFLEFLFFQSKPAQILGRILQSTLNRLQKWVDSKSYSFKLITPDSNNMIQLAQKNNNTPFAKNQNIQNERELILLNKIEQLQRQIEIESNSKSKIERQSFNLNIKMIQINTQIVKQRSTNIKSMREFQLLQMKVVDVEQKIEQSDQMLRLLQDEITSLQQKITSKTNISINSDE